MTCDLFVYKLFLFVNISDFSLFLCKNFNCPLKSHPLFPSNPRLKIEILSSPPFYKFGWRLIPLPPPSRKEGVHTRVNPYQMAVSYQKIKHIFQKQNYHLLILRWRYIEWILNNITIGNIISAPIWVTIFLEVSALQLY